MQYEHGGSEHEECNQLLQHSEVWVNMAGAREGTEGRLAHCDPQQQASCHPGSDTARVPQAPIPKAWSDQRPVQRIALIVVSAPRFAHERK